MSKWRALILCGILMIGLPSWAGAQGFKWWQEDRFKTELSLTPDQCARIDEVYQAHRPKMTAGKESLDRLEKRLSDMIGEGTVPEADVVKQVDLVEAARGDLYKTMTLMTYRMRRLLTPEQRVKMKAIHERWEQERRKTGRGAPGRGGAPERVPNEGGLL
jgi:Spy/CpxP family protein refolding chaperone